MRTLSEAARVELKLFWRDPLGVVFTAVLPLVWVFVLGGVFGNKPDAKYYRGAGPMTYYVPAYIGLVMASAGLIILPSHLAAYRERGVLRRFRASSMPPMAVIGAQVAVALVVSVAGGLLVVVTSVAAYHPNGPTSAPGVMVAFVVGALAFAAIGVLLGAVLPSARAAQGAGIILWFVMLILGGAGPPPEVLTGPMRAIGAATPLHHVILILQDPWLGFGWNVGELAAVAAMLVICGILAVRLLRWD